MRHLVLLALVLISITTYAQSGDTIKVYFSTASSKIDVATMHKLDSLAYFDKLPTTIKYGIVGYADYVGDSTSNMELSLNRANKVKDYLSSLGVSDDKVQMVTGNGEVSRDVNNNDGYAYDRRVDIILGGIKAVRQKKIVIIDKTKPKLLDIENAKVSQTIKLDNILFIPGGHFIQKESEKELFILYLTMRDNPTLQIGIEGHICCLTNKNTDGYDYDSEDFHLSKNRAKFIYDYLVEKGIAKERMTYKGFGISKPLVWPEKNADDEKQNRRVEIRILKK